MSTNALVAPWSLSQINRKRDHSSAEVLVELEESSVTSLICEHWMSFLMMAKFMKTLISDQQTITLIRCWRMGQNPAPVARALAPVAIAPPLLVGKFLGFPSKVSPSIFEVCYDVYGRITFTGFN